jgi:cellulose synthase/poly-beta-1,6-N-acetylglucosamine synthase-like glycosyltransferase
VSSTATTTSPPLVSVVLPVRDGASTLPACVGSIQAQTLSRFEIVAVDDGSTDETSHLLERFAREDPRFRVLRPGRVGLVRALNLGLEAARGELIARMDADDLMHPERLEAQSTHLLEHPALALVACRVDLFPDESIQAGYREYVRWQNECVEPDEIAARIFLEAPFAHPSVMVRRTVLAEVGGYREGQFPEDYDLWLRMHAAGHRMAKLPRTLLSWRESPSRTSRIDPRYARPAFDALRAEYLARDARLHGDRRVVVWGAGRRTRQRARLLMQRGVHPVAWIDIDPRKIGQVYDGLPVLAPGRLAGTPKPFVLVYVTNHGARELIAESLRGLGYSAGSDYLFVG